MSRKLKASGEQSAVADDAMRGKVKNKQLARCYPKKNDHHLIRLVLLRFTIRLPLEGKAKRNPLGSPSGGAGCPKGRLRGGTGTKRNGNL